MADQNKTNDFFSLLERDQKIENPFAEDEILFRDENGDIKVLKGGATLDVDQKEVKVASAVSPLPKTSPVKVKTPPIGKPLKLDQEVESIIRRSGVNLADSETEKRFRSIITARLKDIRDQVQTRELLLSSPLIGGVGLDAETTNRVLLIINQEALELNGRLRDEVSEEPFSDLKAEVGQLLEGPLVKPPKIVFSKTAAADESQAEEVTPAEVQPISPSPSRPVKKEILPPVEPVRASQPIAGSVSRPLNTRPRIEDVRFEPKLTGPVEEIRSMTLIDFRRLAQTPAQAIEKIINKIDLLEEESFTQRNQAIRAWKQNEVNQLYLELGDQSMEQGRPISEIIALRQQAGQPTLTEEEIETIIELNQRLRY